MTADNHPGKDLRRNFLLVVANNDVVKLVSGPRVREASVSSADSAFVRAHQSLEEQFPSPSHRVIAVKASFVETVIKSFPEYSGWETIKREELTIK